MQTTMMRRGLKRSRVGCSAAAAAALAVLGVLGTAAAGSSRRAQADQDSASGDGTGNGASAGAVASVKQYPANKPIEDRYHMARLRGGSWWFAVFDGHGGWQCSDYASKHLHPNVERALANHLGDRVGGPGEDDEGMYEGRVDRKVVTKVLKSAFERTDRQYMVKVFGAFELGFGRDTRAGSCALGTLVLDGSLFVANAGDSRAVLAVNRREFQEQKTPPSMTSATTKNLSHKASPQGLGSAEAEVDMNSWGEDEILGAAALKNSVGEELSPEIAERLRSKLLNQIYELKRVGKSLNDDNEDTEKAVKAAIQAAKALQEEENKNRRSNPFVNAVRMLTGGTPGRSSSNYDATGAGRQKASSEDDGSSEFVALDMSNDHNCREPHERQQLEGNHPYEKDVVICRVDNPEQCYIKGKLQPTRAFGDFYLKYSEFMRGPKEDSAAGRYVPPPYTPPYITATPEVQVRTLAKGIDEFLILATDGLWDMMSSQEAVDIAGKELRKPGGNTVTASEALIEEALLRASKNANMTVAQLKALKAGRPRRSKHDDISVIVVDLARLIEMHYWG